MQSGFFSYKLLVWIFLMAGAVRAMAVDQGGAMEAADRPQVAPCPAGQAPGTQCQRGRDSTGAHYWLAMPAQWNGVLIVHAHGGPELGSPKAQRPADDLTRWSIWTRAGFAYAGSGYRQGGVAVRSAAEDTERVRQRFVAQFGPPKLTVLHGQSWGAGVAVKTAEMTRHSEHGKSPFDAVLLTNGVLGGGVQSYNFRMDLRVVYQALCNNHPRPDEPTYPLWQGLPLANTMTRKELENRIDACTGVRMPAGERTVEQQGKLDTVLRVIGIQESSLMGHMNWATWHFQDIAWHRMQGRNVFGNENVQYGVSGRDDAWNGKVARYRADPSAVAAFAHDADAEGRIAVPVLTMHAVKDPIAYVELESFFNERMVAGGHGENLLQVFTDDSEHSYLSDAQYVAGISALLEWTQGGARPSAVAIAQRCAQVDPVFEPAKGCRFLPGYRPAELSTRVPPR
jgi:alpha-beta hydrolase superfamily lysophospholipase